MQTLGLISLVVADYDEALAFYVGKLGFKLVEDSFVPEQNKRWVVIEPPGAAGQGAKLLLARGVGPEQASRVGNQKIGRCIRTHKQTFLLHRLSERNDLDGSDTLENSENLFKILFRKSSRTP